MMRPSRRYLMRIDLLRKAAAALNDGRDPLTTPFLSDNDVTLDECYDLAEHLALGARIVALGLDNPRSEVGAIVLAAMATGSART
jgi:hypothetical protein